ncbi:hypothetical protein [Salinarimonas soli]|uniref:Uncharacterized protein n=1 Tax=Salinarimonas soli TaxID=1638099 RepID=A0A5B2VDW3_9HYPH|nr:hypothetical protein [Salinarimonas soli]KAA2236612.1 hypothetical protein F0L46_14175 [Salinarimonas soli]
MRSRATAFVAALALWPAATGARAEAGLSFEVSYEGVAPCRRESPRFRVTRLPPGTASLRFDLASGESGDFGHGGGTVVMSKPGTVAPGAVFGVGPCNAGSYVWTARALSRDGTSLATSEVRSTYRGSAY